MKKNRWLIQSLVMLLFFSPLYGQGADEVERAWDFGIGFGYGEQSNPFIGADDVPTYITLDLAVYGKRFFFDNGDVGFTLVDREAFGLNLIATYSSERIYYSFFNALGIQATPGIPNASPPVPPTPVGVVPIETTPNPDSQFTVLDLDLTDRDFAVNSGLELLWSSPYGDFQAQLLSDVSSKHDGQELSLQYSRAWAKGAWRFQPSLGFNWKSGNLVDYYYGLDNSNSEIGFTYKGSAVLNTSLGWVSSYRINNHLSWVASIKYTRFGSSIRHSPLVTDGFSRSVFAGIFYQF